MRLLFTLKILLFFQYVSAQNNLEIKYYDSAWSKTSKDSAFYLTEYLKTGSNYQAISYWVKQKKIKLIAFYTDTSFTKLTGVYRKFYESGQIEDSTLYNNEGDIINSHYYYPNGKIWVNYNYDSKNKKEATEAYDIDNKLIKDFIYFREAELAGGEGEWRVFLSKNIKPAVPIKKGAPGGKYQVIIRFIVDLDGKIVGVEPETNLGFGMEDEVIRVIKKSPKWIPAIWLNKTVKAYRRQPLTFLVE